MKLIDCYIENYGKFSRRSFVFQEGLTCFCLPNGEGKTTFASFLKAMLYGMESYRDGAIGFCDRKRFFPFSGGKFGGWLRIEWQGERYVVERFFDEKSASKDTLRVYDEQGRICKELGTCVGQTVLGVSLDGFERTCFIDTEKLRMPLEGGAGVALGEVLANASVKRFSRAVQLLEEERKRLRSDRKTAGKFTGLLPELLEKSFALEEEIYACEKRLREAAEKRAELSRLEKKISEVERGEKPSKKERKKRGNFSMRKLLFVLFALLGIVVGGFLFKQNAALSLLFFAGSALSFLIGFFPIKNGVSQVEKGKGEWIENLSALLEKRAVLKEEIAACERDCALLAEKKERLKALKEETARLEQKRKAVEIAKDKLLQADKKVKGEYLTPMTESFLHYAYAFDRERFSKVFLDGDLNCYFESCGERRESRHFSDGEKTMLAFSMRLALIDAVYKGEKPLLLLDDPFVYLDEESLEKTEKALKNLAKGGQILYFCCHGARKL